VQFCGVAFSEPEELAVLIIHGYVQQLMLDQADTLGQLLIQDAVETDRLG
jgi:hypothetical protein